MTTRSSRALAVLGGGVAVMALPTLVPLAREASGGPRRISTIEDAVTALQLSQATGWDLVDEAIAVVNSRFSTYTARRPWESASLAFRHGHGQSSQYNLALARILRCLGFPVRVVHASRVRAGANPWFHAGYIWLEVTVDGRTRQVSAAEAGSRAGVLPFVPVTQVRPVHPWTIAGVRVAQLPFVSRAVWSHWLSRRPLPRWLERPFGTRA